MGRVQSNIKDYAHAVDLIQQQIVELRDSRSRFGAYRSMGRSRAKLPVVFTSDSEDSVFIQDLQRTYGWIHVDHFEYATSERYGGWAPGILDSLILSRSLGFVG
jgi:hypothetical protein